MAKEEKLQELPGKIEENKPEKVELSKEEQELRFNHAADGDCPELLKAKEEEKEELAKNTEKELDNRVKTVEKEVNNAETPKAKVYKDGKVTRKIKGMVEKLTLEEPSDVLNEGLEDYTGVDKINTLLSDFDVDPNELLVHIENWLPSDELDAMINDFIIDNDLESEFEDIETEGLQVTPFREEIIDENIPKDLAKAYKRSYFKGLNSIGTDFYNSEYTQLTPDEAMAEVKAGNAKDLRLVIDGKLVRIRSDRPYGVIDNSGRIRYLDYEDAYITGNDNRKTDTAHIPAKHLFKIATKIYKTDEGDKKISKELIDKRAQNPESPRYNGDYGDAGYDLQGHHLDRTGNSWRTKQDLTRLLGIADMYKKEMKDLDSKLASGNIDKQSYDERKEDLTRRYNDARNEAEEVRQSLKDRSTFKRYVDSTKKLREPFEQYKELKDRIRYQKNALDDANLELEKAKAEGSPFTRKNRKEYNNIKDQIKQLTRRLALVELELEDSDAEDEKALASKQQEVNTLTDSVADATAKLNKLLGK